MGLVDISTTASKADGATAVPTPNHRIVKLRYAGRPQVVPTEAAAMTTDRINPCGRALSPVGAVRKNQAQDTTSESTPGHGSCNSYRGPRRPKGHDRLMETVSAPADTPPPPCPICGKTASASSVRPEGNMRTGDYRDTAGHIWQTRWLVVA